MTMTLNDTTMDICNILKGDAHINVNKFLLNGQQHIINDQWLMGI